LIDRERAVSSREHDVESVASMHADVDREARRLHVLHAPRLRCRVGCSACCVDGLTVFDAEADHIRNRHAELLANDAPGPLGACAFLDGEGACRIYAERPYVCRTQGLPLRWIEHENDANEVELRDICPLNEAGQPIETLPPGDCWTIGHAEARLGALQLAGGGGARRTALRDLFGVVPPERP
jgi:uncharacterized protein